MGLNNKPRLAILISGNGSNLQAIIDAIENYRLNATIGLVLSNKINAHGLERAKKHSLPHCVLKSKDYESREDYDHALNQCLKRAKIDWVILAGFMRILTPEFVNNYHGRILNIHPSLLPSYPGLDTHQRVLKNGDTQHGTTVHFVTPTLDAGPIIAQAQLNIAPNDTPETLKTRVQALEHDLYPKAIEACLEGEVTMERAN